MLAYYYQMKTSKNSHENDSGKYYSNLLSRKLDASKDLSTKCRVCLQEGNYSIFEKENADETTEALRVFANILITEDDRHTILLCSICFKFIKQAVAFRKVALRSEKFLKTPLQEEINHEFDDEHDNSDHSFDTQKQEKWSNITKLEITGHKEDFSEVIPENGDKVNPNSKVACHVCKAVIKSSYLTQHMTMHDPNHERYVCDICGKSFRLRCAYHNHSLIHSKSFPFKCQLCPYKAKYGELFKSHMRTHSRDYRYMCTECPARFLVKTNLNKHMWKHRDPQYKCDDCKRAFHTKMQLQQHYQCDHLGIKNHVCNICGKAFGYRNAMMKHQRGVHKREKISFGRKPSYLQDDNQING